jgi:hypothetical protein
MMFEMGQLRKNNWVKKSTCKKQRTLKQGAVRQKWDSATAGG